MLEKGSFVFIKRNRCYRKDILCFSYQKKPMLEQICFFVQKIPMLGKEAASLSEEVYIRERDVFCCFFAEESDVRERCVVLLSRETDLRERDGFFIKRTNVRERNTCCIRRNTF